MILCVTPNPAIDRTLLVPNFRAGAVLRPSHVLVAAGGKGLNVARSIHSLGSSARCMGLLGGHSGRLFAELAMHDGLHGAWTWIANETRTCTIIVDSNRHEATGIYEAGAPVGADDWARFHADTLRAADGTDVACLCGSLPTGIVAEKIGHLIGALRMTQQPVWVDTSGVALEAALNAKPTGIKINGEEAGAVLDRQVTDVPSALDAADMIRQRGIGTVVLTLGKLGAVLTHATGRWWAYPPTVQSVSAVGSGDAFLAGFITALMTSAPLGEALRHGVAAGTANAGSLGGGSLMQHDFMTLLAATSVMAVPGDMPPL